MGRKLFFAETHVQQWIGELEDWHQCLLNHEIPLTKDLLLDEIDVCVLLNITSRTLRNYRKLHLLHYIKLNGRIYYLRNLLYIDLMKLCER